MKKIVFGSMLFLCLMFLTHQSYADSNYQSYEEITMSTGELLNDFSSSDYKDYYKKVEKRKFYGWRVHTVNKDVEVSYITETLFSYYNDGYTAIEYEYKLDQKTTSKVSLSSSGSIGIKQNGTKPTFKQNLEGSLRLSADYTTTESSEESYTVSLKVDPGTQVDLYIYGEGLITNGVAARYFLWMRSHKGGFEAFVVTTQYQRLEKKRI
jgi:hypothetical protein